MKQTLVSVWLCYGRIVDAWRCDRLFQSVVCSEGGVESLDLGDQMNAKIGSHTLCYDNPQEGITLGSCYENPHEGTWNQNPASRHFNHPHVRIPKPCSTSIEFIEARLLLVSMPG